MEKQTSSQTINNAFYDELAEGWYTEMNHPIALLRAENRLRIPWLLKELGPKSKTVLDVGCGGGLLANALAKAGHTVSGIDLSSSSLEVARSFDETKTVDYRVANGYSLPFRNETFDVVAAMDVLEHVEEPRLLISEASRVLKPNGRFFFHTFNRNWISYVLIIKGVEWCVPNAPKNMHVYPLFIKPDELQEMMSEYDLTMKNISGFVPTARSIWQLLWKRKITPDFSFRFSKNSTSGYCGWATKEIL